ncbi:hypothetical protein [Gracilimonas mengyeensis]|uniref:Uncharacterized protein n=1 Tax=Gracilimonas mengyeensis TaxID=1302730 RepID=A0A521ERY3_9BACT|nr:hypothetical protein [Gracilimonas mengyeensis]SMO86694.1 hypothetical protein SAMN06265219_11381 [Gracilimonas mengyeensis]
MISSSEKELLILAEDSDPSAEWAVHYLKKLDFCRVRLVTHGQLASAKNWVHRVNKNSATFNGVLSNGTPLFRDQTTGGINRLKQIPFKLEHPVDDQDYDYAVHEMTTFFVSALEAMPGAWINAAGPRSIAGNWRSKQEWHILAARAGLKTYRLSLDDLYPPEKESSLIVYQGKTYGGEYPPEVKEQCIRLANLTGHTMLGISLEPTIEGWFFNGAAPIPDLETGGVPLLADIAKNVL